jgi:hypothetical protein
MQKSPKPRRKAGSTPPCKATPDPLLVAALAGAGFGSAFANEGKATAAEATALDGQ